MNQNTLQSRGSAGILCLLLAATAHGQTPAPANPTGEDTVTLAEFTVSEKRANPYISKQAMSAARVAMSIQDIPQSVSVVTADFIQDSMSFRMLDAAKYVTPVVESTLPVGGDRYTIRGFQVSHEFIDGMVISGEDGYSMSLAPYNIERIEIIKGPNAILVPGGAPGGQFNPITKSPVMNNQQSVTLELAQYFGNALSTDINRVLSTTHGTAVRLVAAIWDSKGYQRSSFRRGYEVAPSFSWQLSPQNRLVLKGEFVQNREIPGLSVPLDPAVGTDGYARIARGLPRDWSFGNSANDFRHRRTDRITGELFTTLSDHITSHLLLSADHILREDQGGTSAAIFMPNASGALVAFNPTRNPFTGKYEPGVTWTVDNSGATAVATSTVTPIPDPSTWVYRRNNGSDHLYYNEAHFRNDYAGKYDTAWVKSTTVAGVAANFSKTRWKSFPAQSQGPDVPNNNLGAISYTPYVFPQPSPPANGQNRTARLAEMQFYVFETANLFKDHLILSGGASRYFGQLTRTDTTGVQPIASVTRTDAAGVVQTINVPSTNITTNATSYGAVVKPIKQVGIFYSRNISGESMPGSLQAGNPALLPPFRPSNGSQDEYGLKGSLLNDTLTFSIAHYHIVQNNYSVPNSDYYTLVAQGNAAAAAALPQNVFVDASARGWEFEGSYAPNRNLTIIGNVSSSKFRQPNGVRLRAVPDRTWALYAEYRFTTGALNGFGASIGVDYKSDMAGDTVTALTTSKPLPGVGFVPQQPSFLYAGRTLVNVGISYRQKDWVARLQLQNATDKDYILAGGSRTAVAVGDPRSLKASLTYKF